ncbi:hypothetical protein QBC44DRAFT_373821 [Cladorrhinum sp. PSN332]|nr:hypothetical protein QBC44DRAFT_373821 [Cladorrhinum sp. PSN332]
MRSLLLITGLLSSFGLATATAAITENLNGLEPTKAEEIYVFPPSNPLWVENLHRLPDGRLLLSTFSPDGIVYVLDPRSPAPRTPKEVAALPNTTAELGIAALGRDRYAIATGRLNGATGLFFPGSGSIRVILFPTGAQAAEQTEAIPIPDTQLLNGMTPLTSRPDVVLAAESVEGRVVRVNTRTRTVKVASSDPLLAPGADAAVSLGVNGIKILRGHLYFTNSAQGLFARYRIDSDGYQRGKVEVLARVGKATGFGDLLDDFALDSKTGDAYIARHNQAVLRVRYAKANGSWKVDVAVGPSSGVALRAPTAVIFEGKGDLFVSTAGRGPDGAVQAGANGGQVVGVY